MDPVSTTEHQTRRDPPWGKGPVLAYSTTAGKWLKVNCKYVVYHADVYPRWKPTPNFRWKKSPVSASAEQPK